MNVLDMNILKRWIEARKVIKAAVVGENDRLRQCLVYGYEQRSVSRRAGGRKPLFADKAERRVYDISMLAVELDEAVNQAHELAKRFLAELAKHDAEYYRGRGAS